MKAYCQNSMNLPEQVIRDDGRYVTTSYCVFPGIEFAFVEAHGRQIAHEEMKQTGDILEIVYCREGRSEFSLNDEFVFLSAGDLMIVRADVVSSAISFPLKHYHGLTIRIDLDQTPHCLSCFLADVNVQPRALADRFCNTGIGYIARANQAIEHIFSEIYTVSDHIRKGYCKIKTLELLLFLSQQQIDDDHALQGRLHSKAQVLLAERIAGYLSAHMEERITLQQLSALFHISVASIKSTFKGVYGVPVGAYVRTIKMESAAYMLEYTDKTILEIAMEHGYDNASKFAAAFRSVKGLNPAQYRNASCKGARINQTEHYPIL